MPSNLSKQLHQIAKLFDAAEKQVNAADDKIEKRELEALNGQLSNIKYEKAENIFYTLKGTKSEK